MAHGFDQQAVDLDRRNPQLYSDLRLGQAVDTVHQKRGAAVGRQFVQRGFQEFQFLLSDGNPLRSGVFYGLPIGLITGFMVQVYHHPVSDFHFSMIIVGQIDRDAESQSSRVIGWSVLDELVETQECFLRQVGSRIRAFQPAGEKNQQILC